MIKLSNLSLVQWDLITSSLYSSCSEIWWQNDGKFLQFFTHNCLHFQKTEKVNIIYPWHPIVFIQIVLTKIFSLQSLAKHILSFLNFGKISGDHLQNQKSQNTILAAQRSESDARGLKIWYYILFEKNQGQALLAKNKTSDNQVYKSWERIF